MKSIYQILEEIFKIKEATLPKSIKANGLGGTLEDMAEYLDGIDSRLSQIPASSGQNVKKITVRDLTSLTDVNPDDLYLVFSSGNDTDGWSEKNTFTLYNETYQDGTYFQWFNSKWTAVSRDEVNIENVAKFEPLQNNVALISETFPLSSYWNLEGMEQGGLRIATVDCYELDESSKSYKPKTQSANGKSTNKKTLFVPYAKKYKQGGEDKFEGGLLTAADYKWLSGVLEEVEELVSKLPKFTIKVVDELPTEDISDTTVYLLPSASATSGNLYDEYIYVNNKWEHLGSQNMDLKDYAKKSDIPTKLGDLENDVNYATQTWVNSQGYLKAVPSTYALKTEIPTKLSQLSNDASYVSRRSWTPIVGGTIKPSLNGYVIIGYIEHTPFPNNEWAVTINLYGGHNTLHGDTRIRIYATDKTATEIDQTPAVEFIHGGTSFPNVRLYRESATRISIGVYRHNNWTTATCELVNVTGTSFTAITTEEYKSADAEFLVQCKEMPKDTHTTSRREGVTKMFGFSFDDVHSKCQGAMFVVSSRDITEVNPIGLLIVKYGEYAEDGSLDRKNNCLFIRIAGGSDQIVSFFVETNSLYQPVVYCSARYSATLRVTPIHNVKDFVLFDTVVPMPETNLLQVRDETLTDGLLSEDKAAELYQPKGNYLTEHQDISGKLDVSGSNGTAAGVSALINKLTTGTSAPNDADYYVCQYAGGGTSTTSYHRKPMSALWMWLKTKTDAEYKPTRWTPFVSSSSAPTGMVIIGTIKHTPSLSKSWQISIRMLGKHGGTYYGDTTVRLSGVDSSTQVIISEISFVGGSISVPTVKAYRVSNTEIAIGVSKSNSWAGMDCIIENISETNFVTSTAQVTKGWNDAYLLMCNSMPWERKSKSMKVVYEDGTEETLNILYK